MMDVACGRCGTAFHIMAMGAPERYLLLCDGEHHLDVPARMWDALKALPADYSPTPTELSRVLWEAADGPPEEVDRVVDGLRWE